MATYVPRAAVPDEVRRREDVCDACARHDLGRLFYLVRKWGGISYSAIAECTGIKPERVGALARGEGEITSYRKLTEIADGLRLPGRMFGLAARPWETASGLPAEATVGGKVVREATISAFRRPGFSGLVDAMAAADRPDRVSGHDVESVWANVRFVSSWDYSRGGGSMAAAAMSQHVRTAAALLRLPRDPRVHEDLFSAVGSLVLKAGFTAFDVFDHERALQRFEFALACAEEVDDWHLRAGALARLSRQAFWRSDLETARTHVELALVRADRLTATERSMLHALRARVFAALGDAGETLRCVGAALRRYRRYSGRTGVGVEFQC
jgi:transcriptional regulator with XRE-family HTH domain